MTDNNRGIRCSHYFEARAKSLEGKEPLTKQDTMCYSICGGVDTPKNPSCELYLPLYQLQEFKHIPK